jgi:molybdopterin-guanine dinucleotide biosynthesis protein A
MKRYSQVAAFVLAGGASSRMGRDKALMELLGVPLVVRTARLIEPLVAAVTIVGRPERYRSFGLRVIADQEIGEECIGGRTLGPLVGIASALAATSVPWNLVLASDLPYLTRDWVNWLLGRAAESQSQIVVPRTRRGLEPLAAVYRRECAASIAHALGRGIRKVTDALAEFQVQTVEESEWRKFDPDGRVLSNMNTPADYDEARAWWEASASKQSNNAKPKGKRRADPRRRK